MELSEELIQRSLEPGGVDLVAVDGITTVVVSFTDDDDAEVEVFTGVEL